MECSLFVGGFYFIQFGSWFSSPRWRVMEILLLLHGNGIVGESFFFPSSLCIFIMGGLFGFDWNFGLRVVFVGRFVTFSFVVINL